MHKLGKLIKKSDGRILALAVITLTASLFFGYKAVSVLFSSGEETPEYTRTPPKAFSTPEVISIIDADNLSNPRLPDAVYTELIETSESLSKRITSQKLYTKYLVSLGVGKNRAEDMIKSIKSYYDIFDPKEVSLSEEVSLDAVDESSTTTSQTAIYENGAGGAMKMEYIFRLKDDKWTLDSINLDF